MQHSLYHEVIGAFRYSSFVQASRPLRESYTLEQWNNRRIKMHQQGSRLTVAK